MPEVSYAIYNKVSGMELEVDASFQQPLRSLNGQQSAEEVVDQYVSEGAENTNRDSPITAFTQDTLQRGANELLLGLLDRGFVVAQQI